MASDQVSSELSKKEELREAGRRRLEEFRKKKATKKSAGTSQPRISNSTAGEKPASVHAPTPVEPAGSAYRMTDAVTATSGFPGNTGKEQVSAHNSDSEILSQEHVTFRIGGRSSPDLPLVPPKQVVREKDASALEYQEGSIYEQKSNNSIASFETDIGDRRGGLQDNSSSNFYDNLYRGDKDISSQILSNSNVSTKPFAEGHVTNLLRRNDDSESVHPNSNSQASTLEPGHEPALKAYLVSDTDERRLSDTVGSVLDFRSQRASESLSDSLNLDFHSPVNGILSSTGAETYVKRSRPSFLDSLNIDRDSHSSVRPFAEKELTTSKPLSSDFVAPSWVQEPTTPAPVEPLQTPVYSNTKSDFFGNGFMGRKMIDNSMETKVGFSSQRQNEDFAALEQHIEDLTQEKFSLQRAMEASKVLAESLASENSSLTESYNHQASIVSQLKDEMERLQEEIKARLVELEAIKAEFTNAHLECNAADERAKLLASEVINLEEKALRLRSNELKLERELEKSDVEIASYKKKLSSLENERRDFLQTIDALQEEKKLLQHKLRKSSTSGISVDLDKGHAKKDASTSTNDLRNDSVQASSNIQMHDGSDNLLSPLEDDTSLAVEDIATILPPDQVQVIQNINSLISELTMEKEEVMQALISEVSTGAKLKDMNKELSHKLEVQTQRLELLTAQSMASGNLPVRYPTVRDTVVYADEGDEVVERVLGWIMKLFPGGPSKRRTSRL